MAQQHVAQLVRHDADDLAFAARAASNMPRLTNIGPPGSANALISFRFTGVNEYSKTGWLSSGGAAATSALPGAIEVAGDLRRR